MKRLIEKIKYILVVPNTFDPDDLRRRQIINTILIFLTFVTGCQFIAFWWNEEFTVTLQGQTFDSFLIIGFLAVVLFVALLVLNRSRRLPRNLVGWVFMLAIVWLVSVSDLPRQLTTGRSIFAWAIPVTLSVVILPPTSVFIVDLLITIAFLFLSQFQLEYLNNYTLFEIYIVSFISWLGMSIAERAIRDARNEAKKNAAILEGVAEGVLVLGTSHQIVLANRAASELLNTEIAKITPSTENAEIAGRVLSFRWSEVEDVGWVAIVRDISRQIEIDHAKDAILRVVSHEMRTPLASILGFAEMLQSRYVPDMATRIRANAQRMLKLVDDLLDVAQIQAGAFAIRNEAFSPAALVSYVFESFMKPAGEKGIVLDVHSSPALPEQVSGDVQRLEQILSNLVENAIKFTDKGGRVDVSFCAENGRDWQIVVKDTGMGIPPERLTDIFESFRRASDYARRKHQGIGLGLSIVKKIVELSGGSIAVNSIVREGSTFTVTLPTELSKP